MARNNTGNVLRFLLLGTVTVAGGAAIGYYVIGGPHSGSQAPDAAAIQQSPVPAAPDTSPAPTPHKIARAHLSTDYTAPGAPRIRIVEDKTPTLNDSAVGPHDAHSDTNASDATDIPTPDAEASQQADGSPVAPSKAGRSAADATSDTTAPLTPPATPPSPKTTTPDPESNQTGAPGVATTPSSAPAVPPAVGTATTDPEASQTGSAGRSAKTGGRAQYRVQAGSFADAGNARDYVNSLHDRGYDADLHSEHKGDKTIYQVQVGAYRNRTSADQAATDMRRSGVPVTVSPVNP